MLNHHDLNDVPPTPELIAHVTEEVKQLIEGLVEETETPESRIINLVMDALVGRVAPSGPEAKADPQEDAVEREIRREEGIKWAATCAVVALDANLDGSEVEYEFCLSKVINHLSIKLQLSIQKRLLQKDILDQVEKLAAPLNE